MIINHGKKFTHKKQSIVLIFDRVLTSLDDKQDNEFFFATIFDKNIQKTLYFVVSFESYNNFKKDYPKTLIAGFWHSLFLNSKIDLNDAQTYNLKTQDLLYSLEYADNEIQSNFQLISEVDDWDIDTNIDTNLDKFDLVVSPADKAKKQRLVKSSKITIIAVFWVAIAGGLFLQNQQKEASYNNDLQQRNALKKQIASLENKIIFNKQNTYTTDKDVRKTIKALLFLRFKNIELLGDVDLKEPMVKSTTDIKLLTALSKEYPQYKLILRAEQLPTLEVDHE